MQVKLQGDICMIQGTVTRDAEFKITGAKNTKIASFSLAVGKNKDTTTVFATCKAFGRLAEYAANVRKADSVMCIGKAQEREYNGKTYKDFMCDWIGIAACLGGVPLAASVPQSPQPQATPPVEGEAVRDDDDSLPF